MNDIDARAQGNQAERLVRAGLEFSAVVRDQDRDGIGEFLAQIAPGDKDALLVVLAAMVPQDQTPEDLLAWIRFDEFGRALPPGLRLVLAPPRQYNRTAPVKPCGTLAAVKRHYAHGEALDDACRKVQAERDAARQEQRKQRRRAA